jgi:SWIM zinc finger
MPGRWSAQDVLALAADETSQRAAAGLARRPGPWTGTGAAGDLVWGLCAGSGKNPYQAIVDLTGPAYRCTCPSRKFPCKHALALLLRWAGGAVPDAPEPADYARAWLESRREKTRKSRSSSGTIPASSAPSTDSDRWRTREGAQTTEDPGATGAAGGRAPGQDGSPGQDGAPGQDGGLGGDAVEEQAAGDGVIAAGGRVAAAGASAAARRAEERAQRVAGGFAELREWLKDQVRVGLAASVSAAGAGDTGAVAARMVDAQAPGVAGVLRGLPAVPVAAEGWPARLLSEYARLHLLARAYERLDTLPAGLAAVVRSRVGYTTSRQEVLTRPAVTDRWLVLAVRDLVEGAVPGRRIWLRGRDAGRTAMLLTFAGNGYWQDPETARLRVGTELHADLHYYPGQPPMRALTGERHAAPVRAARPEPVGDIDALLAEWAAGIAADPWLTTWPALLTGTPVPPGLPLPAGQARQAARAPDPDSPAEPWYLVDRTGAAVPLAGQESLWRLLAVSGGDPVTIAGEWHGERLLALTVWHRDEAVPL